MNLFLYLMEVTVSAGILIVFILILRKLTQARLPKMMFLLLWDIVIIRLLLPFTFPAKASWFSLFSSLFRKDNNQSLLKLNPTSFVESKLTKNISTDYSKTVLLIIWLAGVVFCLSYFLFYYYKSYRKIRESLPLANTKYINHLLEDLPLKRKVLIRTSDHITTPITYGLFKPKIVLPTFISSENTIQLKHIITHEYIHIKRFDCIGKWLCILAVCLHWFNPLVWLMYFRFNDDLEIICDAQVIKLLGKNEKESYANSLIELAVQQTHFSTLYQGFGKSAVKERIVYIMKFNKTTTFGIGCAVLLFIASTTVFASTSGFMKDSAPAKSENLSEVNLGDSSKSSLKEKEESKDNADDKATFTNKASEKSQYPITAKKSDDTSNVNIKEAKEKETTASTKESLIPLDEAEAEDASMPAELKEQNPKDTSDNSKLVKKNSQVLKEAEVPESETNADSEMNASLKEYHK